MKQIIKKFEITGLVSAAKHKTRACRGPSQQNITAVCDSVAESPEMSIRYHVQELDITTVTL